MKLSREEKHDIRLILKGVRELTISVLEGVDRIASILSRPEQGGDEEVKIQDIITSVLRKEYPKPEDRGYVSKLTCLVSREHIPTMMEEYAQLRTESLRAELDEAKREIERLKKERNDLGDLLAETE